MLEGVFKRDRAEKVKNNLKKDPVHMQVIDLIDTLNNQVSNLKNDKKELEQGIKEMEKLKMDVVGRIDGYKETLNKVQKVFKT